MSAEKLEDKIKCILCRKQICGVKQPIRWKPSEILKTWDERCISSLCEILFKSENHPFKQILSNGGYCVTCHQRVWDLDLTLKMLQKLQNRISNITQMILRDIVENYKSIEEDKKLSDSDHSDDISNDTLKLTEFLLQRSFTYDQAIGIMFKALNATKTFTETTLLTVKVDPEAIQQNGDVNSRNNKKSKRTRPLSKVTTSPEKSSLTIVKPLEDDTGDSINIKLEVPDIDDFCPDFEYDTNRDEDFAIINDNLPNGDSEDEDDDFCIEGRSDFDDENSDNEDDDYKPSMNNSKLKIKSNNDKPRKRRGRKLGWRKDLDGRNSLQEEKVRKRTVKCSEENCPRLFKDEFGMKVHVRRDHLGDASPFPCPQCDKAFSSSSNLKAHLIRHEGTYRFNCPTCQKGFHSKLSLNLHTEANHTFKTFEHKCTVCSKGFETAPELEAHQPIHQGDSPFSCEDCKKVFTNTGDLVRHVQQQHQRFERPFCSICGKTFSTQSYLQVHERLIHPDKSGMVFTCKICNITFVKLPLLRAHQKSVHSDESLKVFQCDQCGKSFKGSKGLTYHMRTHTGERPYICKLCGKGFKLGSHLKKHEQMHSGIRNFVCYLCGKSCTNKDNLKLHEKIHEKESGGEIKLRKSNPKKPKNTNVNRNKLPTTDINELATTTTTTTVSSVSGLSTTPSTVYQGAETPDGRFPAPTDPTCNSPSQPQQQDFRLNQPLGYIAPSTAVAAGASYFQSPNNNSNVNSYRF